MVALDQRGQYESPGPDDPAALLGGRARRRTSSPSPGCCARSPASRCTCSGTASAGWSPGPPSSPSPALFTSFTLLGSGPSQLTGRRADLLDHLGPLLDAGGVQLVHETLEQVAMTDPKAQAVPAPTREFYSRAVPAQLRGRPARHGRRDARPSPTGWPSSPRPGVPLLVAHGEADDAWLPHVQADMAQRLGARHEVINNSIHSPAVENPPRTLEVLLDFWADRGGPSRAG